MNNEGLEKKSTRELEIRLAKLILELEDAVIQGDYGKLDRAKASMRNVKKVLNYRKEPEQRLAAKKPTQKPFAIPRVMNR